jgi:hypothetical protein
MPRNTFDVGPWAFYVRCQTLDDPSREGWCYGLFDDRIKSSQMSSPGQFGCSTTAVDDLEMLEIDASEVRRSPDLIDRILRREIFGVMVRGVFRAEQLARVVERIQTGGKLNRLPSDTFRGCTFGRVLRMADGRLEEYFDTARQIGPALRDAFGEGDGYEERLREIVGALGGGRKVRVPAVGDRTYAPATVRVLDPGGTIFLHCGNETHAFPVLHELTQLIDPAGEISTLMPLALPETGGELEVYDVCFGDPLMDELDKSLGREKAHLGLGGRRCVRVRPGVGDLALFEEGRHYHRVSEVGGERSRWTMGGFIAPARDSSSIYYWS